MKILEIIPQLHVGGAEKFTVDLSNELAAMGHDVTLVVTNSLAKYGDFLKIVDKRVKVIGMEKRKGMDPKLFFRLAKLVKEINPDVVHTHLGAIVYNIFSPILCPNAVYVHTIHNSAEKEAATGGKISIWARKLMFKFGRTIPVSISEESLDSFYRFYGKKLHSELIYNGVSKQDISPEFDPGFDKNTVNLVNVARIMPQKNQLMLVRAVERLNNKGIPVNLYIVGDRDTPEGEEIQQLSLPYIVLLGKKSNPRDYMAHADAFVLSSTYEGMPLTLIESMSVGTIPLATPVGGIVNMIETGKNGIVFDDISVDAIENGIINFLNLSDSEKTEIRKNALKSYDNYKMSTCASNYLSLFNKLKK